MSGQFNVFYRTLEREFNKGDISGDPQDLEHYGRDWTRVFLPRPSLVAFPRNREHVSTLMKLAHEHGVSVVPSGGRTGLSGGAMATQGEVVVSLERMNQVLDVDTVGNTASVQAGVVTQNLLSACRDSGRLWPIDFASKGSSQIGGNIATNAGGVHVLRYGMTRAWVLGLEVIGPQGEIICESRSLLKDNMGLDHKQLFIGTEGTLGIITQATLRLTQPPQDTVVILVVLDQFSDLLRLKQDVERLSSDVFAFEFWESSCSEIVKKVHGWTSPEAGPFMALAEVSISTDKKLEELVELWPRMYLADESERKAEFWRLREGISESISTLYKPVKYDVSLPVRHLASWFSDVMQIPYSKALFGHVADGNVHLNFLEGDQDQLDGFVIPLIQKYSGSFSAEHGIGLLKKRYLHLVRGSHEIDLLRRIKNELDPRGLLNPGKIF